MADHPYKSLPDKAFWRRAVARPKPQDVDPVGIFDLRITPASKVATAGSCFAQHIARHLGKNGFSYYVAEPGHSIIPAQARSRNNYGLFSARYGNIYTARQLLQLFQRATGTFVPLENAWQPAPGICLDPFRPTTQPGGYISETEMLRDREQHLRSVRTMFETLDVFVFTLGLTECWRSREDGAVFPLCPGVEGGEFDPDRYEFYNQTVSDVIEDLRKFRDGLESVNKDAQIVLTVSPVPLMATAAQGSHVLSATTYSKSVLRVAAETMRMSFPNVHYFPSYEIITGSFNRGSYYASDLRDVLERGVEHVMRVFMRHATGQLAVSGSQEANKKAPEESGFLESAEHLIEVECDEVALDKG
jgi:hypothetical protein